jgi:hypothetical protein
MPNGVEGSTLERASGERRWPTRKPPARGEYAANLMLKWRKQGIILRECHIDDCMVIVDKTYSVSIVLSIGL